MNLLILGVLFIGAAIVLWRLSRNSSWPWKLVGRVAAAFSLCAAALTLLLFLFVGGMCGRYEFPPIASRSGKFTADVSEDDCGAVDSFHSSVQLWQNRQGISARLFGKREHTKTVFSIGHDPRLIDLSWKDKRTLLIRYPNDSRAPEEFRCQSQWRGIHIVCVAYAPDYNKPVGKMPPVQRSMW